MASLSLASLAIVVIWVLRGVQPAAVALAATPPAPSSVEGAPPDISSMSPRERFDRLYNRVMGASEQGDTATVTRFSPMAFLAYEQLDSADADARYHAAVLQLHVRGDTAAALRLADSIQMSTPRHLFVFLIRGTAGRLSGDTRLAGRADSEFLAAWDEEMKLGRAEYRDHTVMLEQFRDRARSGGSGSRP